MQNKLKVAAYCRVSTDKEDQANSLSSQIKYFTDYISSHPEWQMCEVYYDEGISGTSIKRRVSFNRMIQDAILHKMDLILTKEVSRFARNTVDTLSYTRKLKEIGVGVFFMNDNIDTRDSDGELRLSIMASIAQEESRKTSERVKWGQKRRMEQGIVFGRDMLGYHVKNGQLFINSDEIDTVKLIYYKFLNEEKGTHVIARELREAGIKSKRVKDWTNTSILRVLRNEKYVGDLCQKKTFTPDYLSHTKKYNRGHEDMIYLKDHHEAIISRDTWEKTQVELSRRSPSGDQKTKHSNRYWCSGKLICGDCGQRFVSRTKKLKNGSIYQAWRCYAAATHGTSKTDSFGSGMGCDNASINESELLHCVEHVMNQIQTNKDVIIKEMLSEIKSVQAMETDVDTAPFYAKIESLNDKKRRAIDLVLDGTITREDLKQQAAFYDSEIESLRQRIVGAESINVIHQEQIEGIQRYVTEINGMMGFDSKNKLLYKEVLGKIVVYSGNTVVVYLKVVPFGVKLHYQSYGRGDKYRTIIDRMEVENL
ncbi:MAG: recombinase family protein [Eubacteriales bacterium]|nr:recombinase family protein [Eubacteriales bacterium]